MQNPEKLSDKELFVICKKWGAEVLEARRKFAGLLPEVHRRESAAREKGGSWIKKRGFTCLYEFAAKLAGMTRDQVDLVVRMDKRFEDKPVLREALVGGIVSANKLARVVSIATTENQTEILKKVAVLSNRALEVFVRDLKMKNENSNGFSKPQSMQKNLHGHGLRLDEDVEEELLEMQSRNLDVNGMLREFLKERRTKLADRKAREAEKQEQEREDRVIIGYPAKRYIPAEVLKIVREEHGDRCSASGCGKSAENLHHEKGFAIAQNHDPRYLKPLCKGHHELAHTGLG